ncbi:Ig-like domain repeat protein [Aeromicrobium stalagmiti]|uniref:Ig-like domain repeat protein n=1 Tax=Aeromicrobium stalagmiti TaxID=2738988 RepID=UPI0015690795|nr:Ig-like domain repeat protein [Aeromicrobium stalagmiti]NRQ49111.1 Ig-like domain repeat protein [Aeromicrobium stalagmiti]
MATRTARSLVAATLVAAGLVLLTPSTTSAADTGGAVSGTVYDVMGDPVASAEVDAFARVEGSDVLDTVATTTTAQDGSYTLPTHGRPVLLRFSQDSGGYVTQWWDDEPSASRSAEITVAAGEVRSGTDATLDPQKITNTVVPTVIGDPVVGRTLKVDLGTWNSSTLRFSYQWYRATDGSYEGTSAQTGPTFKPTRDDYGHPILVRITASQPGASTVTVYSKKTVKKTARGSSVRLSLSSPSRRTVRATVAVALNPQHNLVATGKVTLRCGKTSATLTKAASKTLKKGGATITLSGVASGTAKCTATYAGASNAAGSTSAVKSIRVKK